MRVEVEKSSPCLDADHDAACEFGLTEDGPDALGDDLGGDPGGFNHVFVEKECRALVVMEESIGRQESVIRNLLLIYSPGEGVKPRRIVFSVTVRGSTNCMR